MAWRLRFWGWVAQIALRRIDALAPGPWVVTAERRLQLNHPAGFAIAAIGHLARDRAAFLND